MNLNIETDEIDIQTIKNRLHHVINDIKEYESSPEIIQLRDIRKKNQEKREKIVEISDQKINVISEEYMKEYSNIIEHSNSLRKEIEDILEKVLSQHSTYYFQKLGVGSASIQSLKNPELRSKMNIDTLLRLLQRMLSKI